MLLWFSNFSIGIGNKNPVQCRCIPQDAWRIVTKICFRTFFPFLTARVKETLKKYQNILHLKIAVPRNMFRMSPSKKIFFLMTSWLLSSATKFHFRLQWCHSVSEGQLKYTDFRVKFLHFDYSEVKIHDETMIKAAALCFNSGFAPLIKSVFLWFDMTAIRHWYLQHGRNSNCF